MNWILNKLLTLLVWIRYPLVPSKYRFFIRFRYIGQLKQLKYFVSDYLIKNSYKEIAFDGEFAPELKFILPHAYWHFRNGTLKNTTSAKWTKEFYFFSPKHEEIYESRVWRDFKYDTNLPNSEDHNIKYNFRKWKQVPLKEHYANNYLSFEKPICIIANKYNIEWGGTPVSYLDILTLKKLIFLLKDTYTIVYNRPEQDSIVNDNSHILDLKEKVEIRNTFPDIIFLEELESAFPMDVRNFNHLQLLVYSNCERFISVHGGTAVLASYFGGKNCILSSKGHELYFKEYETIFPRLSNAQILHAKSQSELCEIVRVNF